MELAGARVTVVGVGRSGLSAARLLRSRGAQVVLNDAREREALGESLDEARELGAELVLGGHDAAGFARSDLIVVSPGVPALPELVAAEARGVPVVGEVELASWFVRGQVVGITGTNGKSTVTSLVGAMGEATGRNTFIGGNLGTPLSEAVGTPAAEEGGLVVVELSSFQLERVERLRAHVGVLLNLTEDHLDRHGTFAEYGANKARLFAGQRRSDWAVTRGGDALCMALARTSAGTLSLFGGPDGAVRVEGGVLRDVESGLTVPVAELGLEGDHNLENACAAALAARHAGVAPPQIEAVLRAFRGLPHRMQYVASVDGVRFFDDSKGTNVGAAAAAVAGLGETGVRVVLIAGGKDKGGGYGALSEVMGRVGRGLVLIGEAAPLIERAFAGSGLPIERAADMAGAVDRARALAQPGDVVLLSPACASFDMFRSYAHRGDVFAAAVRARTGRPS